MAVLGEAFDPVAVRAKDLVLFAPVSNRPKNLSVVKPPVGGRKGLEVPASPATDVINLKRTRIREAAPCAPTPKRTVDLAEVSSRQGSVVARFSCRHYAATRIVTTCRVRQRGHWIVIHSRPLPLAVRICTASRWPSNRRAPHGRLGSSGCGASHRIGTAPIRTAPSSGRGRTPRAARSPGQWP